MEVPFVVGKLYLLKRCVGEMKGIENQVNKIKALADFYAASHICNINRTGKRHEMALIVNTEDVNRYGFRILNSALDFSNYEKNPVLLYNHMDWNYPIGRVNNLRLESGQWVADDPEFDEEDEEALTVKGKYDRGYVNASSLRVRVLETSEDPELMLPGQKRPTVTKAEVLELSLVTVPGNGHAVRLSSDQGENIDDILPIVQLNHSKEEEMSLAKIAKQLGITENATEENILQAIKDQQEQLNAAAEQQVENLLALGRRKGFVTDDNEEEYRKLAAKEPDVLSSILEKAEEPKEQKKDEEALSMKKLVEQARKEAGADSEEEELSFDKLQRENPEELLRLKREEPETYAELAKNYKKGVNPAAG